MTACKNKVIPPDIIDFLPYFFNQLFLIKESENIANAWAETTLAAWFAQNSHTTIAIGKEVIMRFITPNLIMEQLIETNITKLFKVTAKDLFDFSTSEIKFLFPFPSTDFEELCGLTKIQNKRAKTVQYYHS